MHGSCRQPVECMPHQTAAGQAWCPIVPRCPAHPSSGAMQRPIPCCRPRRASPVAEARYDITRARQLCRAVRVWGGVAATPQRSPRFEAIWVMLPICRKFMAKLYGPRNTLIRASSPPGAIWYLCWHTTCNLMQQLNRMPVAVLQRGRQSTGLLLLLTLQRHGMAVDRARDRGITSQTCRAVAAATQIRLQTTLFLHHLSLPSRPIKRIEA